MTSIAGTVDRSPLSVLQNSALAVIQREMEQISSIAATTTRMQGGILEVVARLDEVFAPIKRLATELETPVLRHGKEMGDILTRAATPPPWPDSPLVALIKAIEARSDALTFGWLVGPKEEQRERPTFALPGGPISDVGCTGPAKGPATLTTLQWWLLMVLVGVVSSQLSEYSTEIGHVLWWLAWFFLIAPTG